MCLYVEGYEGHNDDLTLWGIDYIFAGLVMGVVVREVGRQQLYRWVSVCAAAVCKQVSVNTFRCISEGISNRLT